LTYYPTSSVNHGDGVRWTCEHAQPATRAGVSNNFGLAIAFD